MMKILYHITNLPPQIAGTEASLQEIELLRTHFGGELVHVNPNIDSRLYWPRLLFGFPQWRQIRGWEQEFELHHFYNADPFPFPILHRLSRPVIYTISSGVGDKRPNIGYFRKLAAVIASDEVSYERLTGWGLANVHLVRPGIDTSEFSYQPLPLESEFRLMVGSAPWTRAQFSSKGFDALLEAAKRSPKLRLVCLWRGVLADEMARRVAAWGLARQVEVINQKVEVNSVLARVHASIALATHPGIIRAYPHSLIESLAAGKPVIISQAIPMARYVAQTGAGEVVTQVTPTAILEAIERVRRDYPAMQRAAQQAGQQDFSAQALVKAVRKVYQTVLSGAAYHSPTA